MAERTSGEIAIIRNSLIIHTNGNICKDSTYKKLTKEINQMRYGGKAQTKLVDESKDKFLTDFSDFYSVNDVYKTKMFDYAYFRLSIHYPFSEEDATRLSMALSERIKRFNVYHEIRFTPYYLTKISLSDDELHKYTYINLYIPSFNMYTKKKFDITKDRFDALDNYIYRSLLSIIYSGVVDVDIKMLDKIKADVDLRKQNKLYTGGKYTIQGIKEANNIIFDDNEIIEPEEGLPF